ncbi:hypothetical protein Tco_0795320 [Tanacetum coccineum]
MATTPTPISSANIPFHTRLRPFSSPSFIIKCSNPLNFNGITDTKSSSKNGPSTINDLAKKDVAEIETQETEARKMMEYISQLETSVSEIAETETESKTMNKNKEKLESVKAAVISAIVGTLASLPISLIRYTNSYELIVSTAIVVVTCALYGATYRYTIRRDFEDFHLKNGTSAAFGIVKGVATLDKQLSLDAFTGAVCVAENVLIFIIAAAGLDICYKMGILLPYPLEGSTSRTKM